MQGRPTDNLPHCTEVSWLSLDLGVSIALASHSSSVERQLADGQTPRKAYRPAAVPPSHDYWRCTVRRVYRRTRAESLCERARPVVLLDQHGDNEPGASHALSTQKYALSISMTPAWLTLSTSCSAATKVSEQQAASEWRSSCSRRAEEFRSGKLSARRHFRQHDRRAVAAATVVVARGAIAMHPTRWLAVGLAMLTMVSACSLKLKILLFNNTRDPVAVHLWKRVVVIAPGKSARFNYPEPNEWTLRTLRISTAGCDVSYVVPSDLQHIPWPPPGHYSPLKAQLEPDLTIFLLPWQTESITSVASLGSAQFDGFPLQPKSRSCP